MASAVYGSQPAGSAVGLAGVYRYRLRILEGRQEEKSKEEREEKKISAKTAGYRRRMAQDLRPAHHYISGTRSSVLITIGITPHSHRTSCFSSSNTPETHVIAK